jgi:hypothetical protein
MCGCANQWANGSMHYFVRSPEKSDTMKGVKALKVGLRRTWGPAVPGAIVGGGGGGAPPPPRGSGGVRRRLTAHDPAAAAIARSGVAVASKSGDRSPSCASRPSWWRPLF